MVKKFTWITGLAMILVAVLAVGVFCAPQASAAQINYGSTNTAAMPQEAKDLQERVNTIDPEEKCPVCNKAVTWKEAQGDTAYSVTTGELHLKVTGAVTATKSWPLEFLGDGGKVHIYLDNAEWNLPALNGPILINTGKNNNELAIFGTGKIHSDTTGYSLISIAGQGNKVYLLGGEYTTASTTKAVIGVRTVTGRNEVHIFEGATIGRATAASTVSQNIVLDNTLLNMYGGTVRNGYRTAHGGNVNLNSTCEFNMYGGTIENGKVTGESAYGGNLYSSGAAVNLYGGTITGGEAYYGGNVCFMGSAKTTISGTALIADGEAWNLLDEAGEVIIDANGSAKASYAGNLFVGGSSECTMSGGKISGGMNIGGNVAAQYVVEGVHALYGNGGNVAISGAKFTMTGGVITEGSSPNGGAMAIVGSASNVTISGGTISDCRSKWGGGIWAGNGSLTISGSANITDNSANQTGGSVLVSGAANATISGGTISNGFVDKSMTALSRPGGNIYMNSTGKLTISGGTISGGYAPRGGNLGINKGTVEIKGNAKIKDGGTFYRGGNIWIDKNGNYSTDGTGVLTISGGTISGGRAPDGGNLYVGTGTTTITGGTITGGQAYYDNQPQFDASGNLVILGSQYRGGNIFALTDLTISGGTISNGESLVSWGGNIYVQEANLTVTGGTITNGKALGTSDGRGGNIAGKKAVVNIAKKASVLDGKALEGGNIYIETQDSQLNISGGKVSGGKAVSGGNVYLAPYMVMMLSSGEVSNGTAEQGGNVYVGYRGVLQQTAGIISGGACKQASTNDGDIDFDDLVVAIASRAGGLSDSKYQGADVYLYDSDYAMMGGTVTADAQSNTSSIYTDAGRVYLGGNATVNAGSIHITETGKLRIDNTWAGSASVLFPKTYAPAEKVEVELAANGNVLVAEDYTILFTPGGEYTEGTLRQGVDSNEAFRAVGKDGVLILGKADCAAMIGSTTYQTLEQALEAAKNGDTIVMHAPATLEELYLRMGRTLDLNGYGLIVTGNVTAANQTAHIIDSSNGAGVLDAKKTYCALNRSNQYLPVWIKDAGFRFVIHSFTPKAPTAAQLESLGENAVMFRFNISGAADCLLAKELLDGGADNGVKVKLKMTWTNSSGLPCAQYFTFTEEQVKQYAYNGTVPGSDVRNDWTSHKFRVTVNNARSVTDLKFTAMLVYDDAVQIASDPCDGYTK